MRVFLHTKMPGESMWKNGPEEFEQVPPVGDYIALKHVGGWYKVTLVVWMPVSAGRGAKDYVAEVYAVAHPLGDAHRAADALVTWRAPSREEMPDRFPGQDE